MRARETGDRGELLVHVIVGQHRNVGALIDAIGPHRPHPGIGFQHLRNVAPEFADLARAFRAVVIQFETLGGLHHHGCWKEGSELFRYAIGADGRAATALRRAKGFVQHEHAGIEAQFAGADLAHDAVEIRVVIKTQATCLMDDPHPVLDVGIVNPHVVGIVDEQGRRVIRYGGLERLGRGIAVLLQHQRDDLEAGGSGGRRIARVSLDRGNDLVPL